MSESYPAPRLGYRIGELCAATGLGRTTIYALIASKQLDVVRVGRCTIITAESVDGLFHTGSTGEAK
jgi:excisionase family DNA binding protein